MKSAAVMLSLISEEFAEITRKKNPLTGSDSVRACKQAVKQACHREYTHEF